MLWREWVQEQAKLERMVAVKWCKKLQDFREAEEDQENWDIETVISSGRSKWKMLSRKKTEESEEAGIDLADPEQC